MVRRKREVIEKEEEEAAEKGRFPLALSPAISHIISRGRTSPSGVAFIYQEMLKKQKSF